MTQHLLKNVRSNVTQRKHNLGAGWGGWLTTRAGNFAAREKDFVRIIQEAGWAPGPVWTGAEKLTRSPPPPGFDHRTFQPVASRYTECAIVAHLSPKHDFEPVVLKTGSLNWRLSIQP